MDTTAANNVTAPTSEVSSTYVSDFAWMMPNLPDHAFRLYVAVRAFIFDKDPSSVSVQITDDELGKLTDRSESAVKRARKACYRAGVLRELSCRTERVPGPGKHQVRTVRELSVALSPWQGYDGPTNCYTERRRLRTETPGYSDRSLATGQSEQGNGDNSTPSPSDDDPDPAPCPADPGISPDYSEGSLVIEPRSKVTEVRSQVTEHDGNDVHKPALQVPLQVSFQPSTHAPVRGADPHGWMDGNEHDSHNHEGEQAGESSPVGGDEHDRQAGELVAALAAHPLPVGARYRPNGSDHEPIAAALRRGMTRSEVWNHLTDAIGGTRVHSSAAVVRSRLGSLTRCQPTHAPHSDSHAATAPSAPARPCGQCQGRPGESWNTRQVEDANGHDRPCPRCHPRGMTGTTMAKQDSVSTLAQEAAAAIGVSA